MALLELPRDAWPAIACCLTGGDLFALARASRWSWQSFSQDDFWRDRLSHADAIDHVDAHGERRTALQLYMRAYSFQFQGLSKEPYARPQNSRGSCAVVPTFYSEHLLRRAPFAFDLWFSLLDGDRSNTWTGGILFATQSFSHEDNRWLNSHQQFAIVSSNRTLYCSVVDEKPEIASNLQLNRWYHLALTHRRQMQKVYLDGRLVSTLTGELHHEWRRMGYAQFGTGCVTANEQNLSEPQAYGWYPFNGLINDCRMWKHELSSGEIQALAQDRAELVTETPHYSLRASVLYFPPRNVTRVGCSRPKERVAELLSSCKSAAVAVNQSRQPASAASRGDRNQWQQSRRANGATRRGRR